MKKYHFYVVFVLLFLLCGCSQKGKDGVVLPNAVSEMKEESNSGAENISEVEYLNTAKPGIEIYCDLDGDNLQDKVNTFSGWHTEDVVIEVTLGNNTYISKTYEKSGLPYLSAGDLNLDGKDEIMVVFEDGINSRITYRILTYQDAGLQEMELLESEPNTSIGAYAVNDKEDYLRVFHWEDQEENIVGFIDYFWKNNSWTIVQEGTVPSNQELGLSEKIAENLMKSNITMQKSDTFSQELFVDINGDQKGELIQVRDASFDGNRSYTQIRAWVDGECIDYSYTDNFCFTKIAACDVDCDSINEILVCQYVVASNYGAIIPSFLSFQNGEFSETLINIEEYPSLFDMAIVYEEDQPIIKIASIIEQIAGKTKVIVYDLKFSQQEMRIENKEIIEDYFSNQPEEFTHIKHLDE